MIGKLRRLLKGNGPIAAGDSYPTVPADMTHVHILDTAIASSNIGDEIIVEAALHHLSPILADCYVSNSSSHDGLGPSGLRLVENADLVLLVGSNALAPFYHVGKPFIWHLEAAHVAALSGKLVLVGVGANRRFETVEPRQRRFLGQLLMPDFPHSVRDQAGAEIVKQSGREAVNTTCPTLWRFTKGGLSVPQGKSDAATFTLTMHKPHSNDRAMVDILRQEYSRVYFWPQQPRDLEYLREIAGEDGIEVIAANLKAYDRHLRETPTDVIGTRLHGSIRGLQHGRRTIVISIDNRAEDMSHEVGLASVRRDEIPRVLAGRINLDAPLQLNVPVDQIEHFATALRSILSAQ